MKYLLMIYASETAENAMPPAEMGAIMQAYGAYTDAVSSTQRPPQSP